MAKGKRSKVKQKHKREYNARIKPDVDARVRELHVRCVGDNGNMQVDTPAPAPAVETVPTEPAPVNLVNTLAPRSKTTKVKAGKVVSRVQKSTATNKKQVDKARLKLRVTSAEKKVLS